MKIPQWWDIEDDLIKWGFWSCIGAGSAIGLYVLWISIQTLPGALKAFGFI